MIDHERSNGGSGACKAQTQLLCESLIKERPGGVIGLCLLLVFDKFDVEIDKAGEICAIDYGICAYLLILGSRDIEEGADEARELRRGRVDVAKVQAAINIPRVKATVDGAVDASG